MGQIQCSRGKFHTQLTLPLRESLGMKRSWSQFSFGVSTICFRDRGDERGLVTFPAIVQQRAQTARRHQNAPRLDRSASMHVFSQKLFSIGLLYIKKHGCFHFVRRSRNPLYVTCACFQKKEGNWEASFQKRKVLYCCNGISAIGYLFVIECRCQFTPKT